MRKTTPASLLLLAICLSAACGKKGAPLAPFPRVPAQVASVTALRIGDDVYVSFPVPIANVDGNQPADIERLEIYAVTATRPPDTEGQREVASLVASLPVRPILPEPPVARDGTPLPAPPLPPGVERGATAVVKETLTPASRTRIELPVPKGVVVPDPLPDMALAARPLVAPAPIELARRHYFVIGVSPRGRVALPSVPVSIPLDAGSGAPGAPDATYTASEMTLTWPPSPDARTATFVPPPPPASQAAATTANASPGNVTPAKPVTVLPPLAAKSLGFTSEATRYHVYEVPKVPASADPLTLALPAPLTPQPLAVTTLPIKGVGFGMERCFFVRPVDSVSGAVVQGLPSPTTCVIPRDTFPPAAPRSLAAIANAGVINLIWEPNTEPDLAGYLVLRGEAPGDKLQALTTSPITTTNYRDTAVTAGIRYVYVMVAVDRADPQNVSAQSNRAEETARQ